MLQWTTAYFQERGIEQPRVDAEILLAHVLGVKRIELYLNYNQPLVGQELGRFKKIIKRRLAGEPVAYIVGMKEFWSLPLQVNPAVLIPRPETETVVETALGIINASWPSASVRVLELGTGSGAITIALASELAHGTFYASDFSLAALAMARQNAKTHRMEGRIHLICADWLSAVRPSSILFNLIVSNPPYVRSADMTTLSREIREHEPALALDGEMDGLGALRRIISTAGRILSSDGALLLEIGFDQAMAVKELIGQYKDYRDVEFKKDYTGHDRVAVLYKKLLRTQ